MEPIIIFKILNNDIAKYQVNIYMLKVKKKKINTSPKCGKYASFGMCFDVFSSYFFFKVQLLPPCKLKLCGPRPISFKDIRSFQTTFCWYGHSIFPYELPFISQFQIFTHFRRVQFFLLFPSYNFKNCSLTLYVYSN